MLSLEKLWQGLLFAIFVLWAVTLYRALNLQFRLNDLGRSQLAGSCHLRVF